MGTTTTKVRPAPTDVDAFHRLIREANAFAAEFSQWQPLGDKSIGASEWTVLKMFGTETELSSHRLRGALGVSRQRMKQISDRLKELGFINVAAGGDAKRSLFTVTESGKKATRDLDLLLKMRFGKSAVDPSKLTRWASGLRSLRKSVIESAKAS